MQTWYRSSVIVALTSGTALAQWDPNNAQWGKTDARDVRIMQYNIRDTLCRTNTFKTEGQTNWCALARIVAAMKPDVLIMQEVGDNDGNGSGTGVDSVAQLTTVLNLWLHGGNDPFIGGNPAVTSWVQKYAPTYDLPYIYVSDQTDNFNRNVILSRYPFADLNGDTKATYGTFIVTTHLYAPGGTLGIRGFAFAEINLPNASYGGDMIMGCAHLKSGGTASDLADRLLAAQNTAYLVDHFYNGGGTATPDPFSHIIDNPSATSLPSALTPVIIGGDMNEDENTNGRDGPVLWISRAASTSGDGTDRNRTDCLYEDSRDFFAPATRSTQSSSKLDYLIWQDSITTMRRSFIFNTSTVPIAKMPAEIIGLPVPATASTLASDHRPVIADFIMPLPVAPGSFSLVSPANLATSVSLTPTMSWTASSNVSTYTLKVATDAALTNVLYTSPAITGLSQSVPSGVLAQCQMYFWSVSATNVAGTTTPVAFNFSTIRPADFNGDGSIDFFDYLDFVDAYSLNDPSSDFNGDSFIDFFDYLDFVDAYSLGC